MLFIPTRRAGVDTGSKLQLQKAEMEDLHGPALIATQQLGLAACFQRKQATGESFMNDACR